MYYYAMELARGSDEGWLGKGYMGTHPYDTSDLWAMYVSLLIQLISSNQILVEGIFLLLSHLSQDAKLKRPDDGMKWNVNSSRVELINTKVHIHGGN
jgi:hypothetical protein